MEFARKNQEKIFIALLLLISIFLIFWNIWKEPVKLWDEGTNAEIVYETYHSKNPFELQFLGRPFFEKPPLWYYFTQISISIFGYNELGIRFISALGAIGSFLAVFLIGKRFFSFRVGILSWAILLASRALFSGEIRGVFASHTFRSADADSLHIFLIILSFYFFLEFFKNKKSFDFYAGIIFSALSFMTKGPLGLLPIFAVGLFLFINSGKKILPLRTALTGILFCLAIVIPWHVYQIFSHGRDFINAYLGYHILTRGISPLEGHNQNFFFYFELVLRPEFFFSGLLLLAGVFTIKDKKPEKDFKYFGLLCIILTAFIIVTAAQTKISWYIFYIIPLGAVAAAIALDQAAGSKFKNIYSAALLIIAALIAGNIFSILSIRPSAFNLALNHYPENVLVTKTLPARDELFYLRKNNFAYTQINELGICGKQEQPDQEKGCVEKFNICQDKEVIKAANCNRIGNKAIIIKKENLNLAHRYKKNNIIPLDGNYMLLK